MKVKKILFLLLVLLLGFNKVTAASFSTYLPGGKNYIDPLNFTVNETLIYSKSSIKVKPNQTYTLSFPGEGWIEFPEILIEGNQMMYFEGVVSSLGGCSLDMSYAICTFTTHQDETFIDVEIGGNGIGSYIDFLGFEDFQLEEGSLRTSYEPYVIPLEDINSPSFRGSAAFIKAYYENYTIQDIIDNHIVVVDDIDGDITDQVEIITDHYTPNQDTVGEYDVVLRATDQAGNQATFTLTIIVKDEIAPSLAGPNQVSVSVDNILTIDEIINSHYSAYDGYDLDLLVQVDVDEYTVNNGSVGTYQVILYAEDVSGNRVDKNIEIVVYDDVAPAISTSNNQTVQMSNPKTIEEVIDLLNINDNYDKQADLVVTVMEDNYTDNSSTPGEYTVLLDLADTSGNSNQVTVYINLVDDIAPTISGPNSMSISYTEEYVVSDFINELIVNDNVDTLTQADIQIGNDTFTNHSERVGTFSIEFYVLDSSGNYTEHVMNISVIDDQAPIIYVDNFLVTVSPNASFTQNDAMMLLINNKEIPDKEYKVNVLFNEYDGNETNPGTYRYSLQLEDEEGTKIQKEFMIKVPDESIAYNEGLLVRNIILYGVSIGFLIFIIYKTKK